MHTKKKVVVLMLLGIAINVIMVYFIVNFTAVDCIVNNYSKPTDRRSTIGVRGLEGEVLTFKLTSKITEGEIEFSVMDSEENIIGSFGQDISGQKIVFEKDDTYEIVALSKGLVGNFRLKVYKK